MATAFTNRLINESSPYLQQHAHNPVDWYPWGKEALDKAKELNLPILVSIGYSACHWCHVMEHESFEDKEVAEYMNANFINIKIDREERPDLDHIYMDAVQAIAGSGGWPLNVFLTPETKPFYGGTYFPPVKAFNRASWKDILSFITTAWKEKREQILEQADTLLQHIHASGRRILKSLPVLPQEDAGKFTVADCENIVEKILETADRVHGGFGAAPKFPQTFIIQYLLMHGYFFHHEAAMEQALLSLKKMLNGGIYDHVGGGMARYSTDNEWLAPHFEKMLYDNALLISVLCDAYLITRDACYKQGIIKTLQFFMEEMKDKEGGYYAAVDADSEGVEGKYYVWDKKEIHGIITEDAGMCCNWYGITEVGNWEGRNILHIHTTAAEFAQQKNITVEALEKKISRWNELLKLNRRKRIAPAIDDKILLGWNALMLTAFCKAYAALREELYKKEAVELFDFIQKKYKNGQGGYYHTYKNGKATQPAFLDDYAALIQACILLQEISFDQHYLQVAIELTDYLVAHFSDDEMVMFCFTHDEQSDVLLRKTEIYDGAVASGNSMMAENLFYLSVITENSAWLKRSEEMVYLLKEVVIKYPGSFGVWAGFILKQAVGIPEIVVTGKDIESTREDIMNFYLPNKIFQGNSTYVDFPLFNKKSFNEKVQIYLCKHYSCSLPVVSAGELKKQIFKEYLNNNLHNI